MDDWVVLVLFWTFIFAVVGIVWGTVENDKLPRGLRWMVPLWENFKGGLRWTLLRIFYPERLPATVKRPGVAKGACADCYAGKQPRGATHCWSCRLPLVRVGDRATPAPYKVQDGTFYDALGDLRDHDTGMVITELEKLEYLDECYRKGWTIWSDQDGRWCPPAEQRQYEIEDPVFDISYNAREHERYYP